MIESIGTLRRRQNRCRDMGELILLVDDEASVLRVAAMVRRLEELRDHLGRNIQETLAIEVAFLEVFGS